MNTYDLIKSGHSRYINEIPRYKESEWIHTSSIVSFGNIPFESRFWHTMILRYDAIPEDDSPNTAISFRPGNEAIEQIDLIRFKYKYKNLKLTLYESGSILYTKVENFANITDTEIDFKKKIMIVCNIIFNVNAPLDFKQISHEGNYTLFSTNPEFTLVKINDWSDRIDCFANEQQIVFMMFKVSLEGNKLILRNPYGWFPKEMRNYKP